MPVTESRKLAPEVAKLREDIVQGVQEAEDTYFYRAYKASVVMCRRAVQLALEHHTGKQGLTLGPLLIHGRTLTPPALLPQTDQFAERILNLGNEGAHKRVPFDPDDVRTAIHDSVVVVNELLTKPPASQSRTDSNAR